MNNSSGVNSSANNNQRQKTNQNIQVYVRVRPLNARERGIRSAEVIDVVSPREIMTRHFADSKLTKKFTFDRTFGTDSKQSDVYYTVVAPLIEEVLAGYNCTVFAYGQTGTGKTHTMVGTECAALKSSWEDDSEIGIIPRALSHLFDELRLMELEFSMRISYLELYNEELCDLLSSDDSTKIRIFDDSTKKGSVIIQGLEEIPVHSKDDVYKLLEKGKERRRTATTLMNAQSSRSHTVFSILVHIRENGMDGEEMLKIGKLNLVDLAGSENVSKAGNEKGIRVRETVNINQSLLTLGRVITALVERTPHIPYRESKLTRLLQESLGGRTKTSIIATISPGHKDIEETLSTLEYAHRAKNIQNKPEVNQKLTKKTVLKEYTEEIDKLKRDLMAARDKNGIYLAEETYNELTLKMDSQNRELNEKMLLLKALKDELQNKEKIFNEVSLNLVEKTEELMRTESNLTHTKGELLQTKKVLNTTKRRYKEKQILLKSHLKTEQELTTQATKILEVADLATNDSNQLHITTYYTQKRTKCDEKNDMLKMAFSYLSKSSDAYDHMGQVWGTKVREMEQKQRIFVKRAINEIIYEGQMGLLRTDCKPLHTSSQQRFGMLESGCVSIKNEVNIMMKNVIDIVLGGFTYWLFGYGMSFGRGPLSNPFIAIGDFLLDPPVGDPLMGQIFAAFLFQLSFATTATTIVSGAMAERCNFKAYCLFSFLNTAVYCIPAGWVWGEHGFLNNLGAVDIAGSGPVHLIGGCAAFASAAMLGPRLGRYADGYDPLPLGNPVNACMGLFVLWWGWLAFNSGSTYGVSGSKWQYAARAAVMTMMGSFGGGFTSCIFSMWRHDGRLDIIDLINGVLGSLVSITAGCFLYRAWEALVIGLIGSLLCVLAMPLFDRLGVDDPVGASAVHGVCGIWGVIAVGLFADNPVPLQTTKGRSGLFKGGGWYLVGIQSLSAFCLACWGICSTFLLLYIVNKIVPIRMDPNEELLGADLMEHRIRHSQIGLSRAISALAPLKVNMNALVGLQPIGYNPGHERSINQLREADDKLQQWQSYLDQMSPHLPRFNKNEEQIDVEESNTLKRTSKSPGKQQRNCGNVFSRKLKSVTIKHMPDRNLHTNINNGVVGSIYKQNNSELPILSTKQLDKDTNFAWID